MSIKICFLLVEQKPSGSNLVMVAWQIYISKNERENVIGSWSSGFDELKSICQLELFLANWLHQVNPFNAIFHKCHPAKWEKYGTLPTTAKHRRILWDVEMFSLFFLSFSTRNNMTAKNFYETIKKKKKEEEWLWK